MQKPSSVTGRFLLVYYLLFLCRRFSDTNLTLILSPIFDYSVFALSLLQTLNHCLLIKPFSMGPWKTGFVSLAISRGLVHSENKTGGRHRYPEGGIFQLVCF